MATRNDRDLQERRRRLRERQERERREMRRRQQEQTAVLNEIDAALRRLEAARGTVAAAVARGVEVFRSAEALAEVVPLDVKEVRLLERGYRRRRAESGGRAVPEGIAPTSAVAGA